MKLNRKWLLAIALVLSLTMAISGTLAYLTDRDTVENTFTMGNVDIEVEENFDQNSPLNPGVSVTKEAGIKNTHATEPAYVWMVVSVPNALANYIELDWAGSYEATPVTSPHDGYTGYLVKYPSELAAGSSTGNILESVKLAANVDYQNGQYVAVSGGQTTPIGDLSNVSIMVDGFAIQTEGFDGVDAAYAAYTTQWGGLTGGESGTGSGDDEEANYGDDDSKTWAAPADAFEVDSTETLLEALYAGKTTILLKDGDYVWKSNDPNDPTATAARNKTLNLYGESRDGVVIHNVYENGGDAGADYDFQGSTVNFYGLTLSTDRNTCGNYEGWAYMTATYNDCVIEDNYTLYGDSTFNYCTLNVSGDKYNIWTYGAGNVTFDHCTFNSDGKALLVYNQSCNVKVSNCLFNDNGGLDTTKAAIETGTDADKNGNYNHSVKHNIVVTNTKVNGYAVNTTNCNEVTTTLWANKNGLDHDHLNVTVDGADVY